ncbi:hypothetical protein V5799_025849 [Amblyomma americanum]|uniref:Uncharacterized protein n=1 Tax=Amblyomma americanum TaxID=6943 RepID=A0AAQ4E858_AMBAM
MVFVWRRQGWSKALFNSVLQYMAAAGAHPYGSPAPTLYQQAPQLVQQIPLSEDPSNGGLGNGEEAASYQGYPK